MRNAYLHVLQIVISSSSTFYHELSLLLIKLQSNLAHRHFIKVRPLEESVDAVDSAHHISSLLLEVDKLNRLLRIHDV
jgi:hypothetical protein